VWRIQLKPESSDSPDTVISVVQDLIAGAGGIAQGQEAFNAMMDRQLWRRRKKTIFDTFPAFAVAPKPAGLGVNDQSGAELLLHFFWKGGYLREAAGFLDHVAREPGHPPKTLANGEVSHRFLKVSTGSNARHRILLRLVREHPPQYEKVCNRELSLAQAATQLGWVQPLARNIPDFYSRKSMKLKASFIRSLQPVALRSLLDQIWGALGDEERREFLQFHAPSELEEKAQAQTKVIT
jgi:hypothetical protein